MPKWRLIAIIASGSAIVGMGLAYRCAFAGSASNIPPEALTAARGMDYRNGLLETFEGTLTQVAFFNREVLNYEAADIAQVRFFALDRPNGRWLAENLLYYYPLTMAERRVKHDVHVHQEGLWGRRRENWPYWLVDTASGTVPDDSLNISARWLFLRDGSGATWRSLVTSLVGVTMSHDSVDGHECLVVRGRTTARTDRYIEVVLYIDLEKGFALRYWRETGYFEGSICRDEFGHAYEFGDYGQGLWLPSRTVVCSRAVRAGGMAWEQLTQSSIVTAQVNEGLSADYFEGLEFDAPRPTTPYEWLLASDAPEQLRRRDELRARLEAGPGDVEALFGPP